jgi:hypothetical protein
MRQIWSFRKEITVPRQYNGNTRMTTYVHTCSVKFWVTQSGQLISGIRLLFTPLRIRI